jgi:predicted nicotinamide N-methyase
VREHSVVCSGIELRVLAVDDLANHVDTEALLRDADAAEPPYWAHLWLGSRVLADLVATEIDCRDRRVIEVGCGLGLASIAAARSGGRVLAVDHVLEALMFARANAQVNECRVEVTQMDLCRPAVRGKLDLILAADATYGAELQNALAAFLATHMSESGEAWSVESVRTTDRGFHHACQARDLIVEEQERLAMDEGRPSIVRITRVRHR